MTHERPIAQCTDLGHAYGRTRALDNIDLALAPGEVTALLGPNGAGKSTLIHLLLGLLPCQTGTVEVFGLRPDSRACRERVGAMLQISGVQDNLTVRELLGLFAALYPQPADTDELLDEVGLEGLGERRFGQLSGGQRQRVLLALALIGQPELLILDEPTSGLDPAARQRLWQTIEARRARGTSILLCTHYMEEAERLADRVVILHEGRILIHGSPADIRDRVPTRVIRARTSLPAARLSALEAVRSVDGDRSRRVVLTTDAPATLRDWLAADPGLADLEVTGADLETAFLSLIDEQAVPAREAA